MRSPVEGAGTLLVRHAVHPQPRCQERSVSNCRCTVASDKVRERTGHHPAKHDEDAAERYKGNARGLEGLCRVVRLDRLVGEGQRPRLHPYDGQVGRCGASSRRR